MIHDLPLLTLPGVVLARHRSEFPLTDVTSVYDASVTTLPSTVLDCALVDGVDAGLVVADHVLHRQPVTSACLANQVQQMSGRHGIDWAASVVAEADARAESPFESLSRIRLLRAGLPRPMLQALVGPEEHRVHRVDFFWPEHRTIGEAEGLTKYGSSDAQVRDAIRR